MFRAFASQLPDKRRKAGGHATTSGSHTPRAEDSQVLESQLQTGIDCAAAAAPDELVQNGHKEEEEESDDRDEEQQRKELQAEEQEDVPAEPHLERDISTSGRSERALEGWDDGGPKGLPSHLIDEIDILSLQATKAWSAKRQASRTSALDSDVMAEMEQLSQGLSAEPLLPEMVRGAAATDALVGHRVRTCGLTSMGELNGQYGVAVAFDGNKQRYRVRLDSIGGERPRLMAFRASNLERL